MSTEVAERPRQRTYTTQEVEAGLQAAAALGSALQASQRLGIPCSTLTQWQRETHRDRWLDIREKTAAKTHAQVAAQIEDMLLEIGDAKQEALTRFRQEIGNLAGKDASAAVKNLAIAEANGIDKVLLLRGKPTHRIEVDVGENIRALVAMGVMQTVDGTAEEAEPDPPNAH